MADSSAGSTATVTRVGDYEVLMAGSPVAFWPLDPDVDLARSRPPIVAAPVTGTAVNTVVIPAFGVFDILLRTTAGVVPDEIPPPRWPPRRAARPP